MFKPSDFKPCPARDNSPALVAIETAIDKNLAAGILNIENVPYNWRTDDIEQIAERYRALGWRVETRGSRYTLVFSLPDPQAD